MMKRTLILILTLGCCMHALAQQSSGNSLTASVLPAYNWLKYGKNDVRSEGDFDVGFGLTFRTQVSKNWQLAIGVNYRKYNGFIDFNGMRDSVDMIEPKEGHNYFLHQIFNNTETQSVTYLEPNIRLEYVQPLTSRIDFIAGVGLGYGINIAETHEMTSGSYRRYAWLYNTNNFINYLPSMNLDTFTDFLNPLPGKTFKHSLFALGEIGFRFRLSENWQLLTLLNLQHSLLNIQAKQDVFTHYESYSGIAASDIPQGVRAISAGLEVGLSYRFGKPTKQPAGHRMMQGHCPTHVDNWRGQQVIFNRP